MKIACVVLTYNRLSLLKRCIDSIRNQTYQEFDIYVIDNASTDGTAHWLSLQNDLTVISKKKPLPMDFILAYKFLMMMAMIGSG